MDTRMRGNLGCPHSGRGGQKETVDLVNRWALAPVFFRPLGRSAQTLVFTTQRTGIVPANCETVNLGRLTANELGTTTR